MKTIKFSKIIATLFLLGSLSMFSNTALADNYCSTLKDIAAEIMKYRQEGVDFNSMYSVAVKNDARTGSGLEKIYVQMAFLQPRLFDMQAREILIQDFSQGVYDRCTKYSK